MAARVHAVSADSPAAAPAASLSKLQLTGERLSPRFANAVTAVRGPHTLKALKYDKLIKQGETSCDGFEFPFERVVFCNIGNPQAIGQKPITFVRQVLSLLDYPQMLDHEHCAAIFPADVIRRARELLQEIPGGTGSYSESQGLHGIRRRVADFIERRDGGVPASPEQIYLTDGASPAVQMALQLCIRDTAKDAIMVPIPQYPLYQGSINLFEGQTVGYYLDEENSWGLDAGELERAYAEGVAAGLDIRAMAVINPGNPVGNCLSAEDMRKVVRFCVDKGIVLLADEVYQSNLYIQGKPFTSFKRVASEEGVLGELELLSFHSVSKGFFGECGRRGGYIETSNITDEARAALYRMMALGLCANIAGQVTVGLMVDPPVEGDESFALYEEERVAITSALERKATLFWEAFNEMEGVSCNRAEGALYLFPSIRLPPQAVAAAEAASLAPDAYYADKLLDGTGIVVVPGSGFRQKPGTHHVRFAFLPAEDDIRGVIDLMTSFHANFMREHSAGGN